MPLRVFNTLTGEKEIFSSESGDVGLYVCGITPYDITHVGHAFTYTFYDVVLRYLRYLGYRVKYVQNLTDIDDDILRKANEVGADWRLLAEKNTQDYLEDMRWLNNIQPDVFPRATDHINDIIQTTAGLLRKGSAYERNGTVYFDTEAFKSYGKLSNLTKEEMIPTAKERGGDPSDPNKKKPLDFVLWQAKKPGEPSWSSPWGQGRPGWHIECSVMSTRYLGDTIDIHGGGGDLIYPHHESSIAQSESHTGKPFVRYWMHTGMVRYQGEKMSKSLGNLVLLSDLQRKYSPNILRLCILSHHYRAVCEYSEDKIREAADMNEVFRRFWRAQSGTGKPLDVSEYESDFFDAMNDDFNTPGAVKVLHKLATRTLESDDRRIEDAKAFLNKAFNTLGLVIEFGGV